MKKVWLCAIGIAALLLASCGGGSGADTTGGTISADSTAGAAAPQLKQVAGKHHKKKPELPHLELTLAGHEDPESAGFVMADHNGYFVDAGLEVDVLVPAVPSYSMKYVLDEVDDIGVVPQPQLVLAREKGFPIVAVGSVISRPTATLIWLRGSGIDGIADLKGKTIAVPGLNFQRDLLGSLLRQAGLTLKDVKVKSVQYKLVPSLVNGRADAIFGGSANIEGVELENRGLDPVVIPAKELGLPAYEQLVVVAREDRVAEEPEVVRGFMAAVRRGAAAAIRNPSEAVQAIETGGEVNLEASRKDTKAELAATLPLLSMSGRMSPARARRLVSWMRQEGLIQRTPAISSLLTNRYLRKQGP